MLRAFCLFTLFMIAAGGCGESKPGNGTTTGAPKSSGFTLPQGDPVKGRETFAAMMCFHCHEVPGEGFEAPVATPPVQVPLNASVATQTAEQLAESIIAPSHKIPDSLRNTEGGRLSRMGDFSNAMTVRELFDMVAYLKTLKGR